MKELLVIDNFLPDPDSIRQDALSQNFYDWLGPDGQTYKRIFKKDIPIVIDKIEEVVGVIELLGMAYRLNYNDEPPNQAIHSDTGWGTHALVLYLCSGSGGTAFWQHKPTGERSILEGETELYERVKDDFEDVDKWYRHHLIHLKYNRALIYESSLFHSRYPFQAFGSSPSDGRLIVVAFFNLRKDNDS